MVHKNHFNPSDEQKMLKCYHKNPEVFKRPLRSGASNAFRLVLDTVTPCMAAHGSPRPLYSSRIPRAPAFKPDSLPEWSLDLPGGPGCAHEPKFCPTGVQLKLSVFRLEYVECYSILLTVLCFICASFVFQMRRTSDDAPKSPLQGVLLPQSHPNLICQCVVL